MIGKWCGHKVHGPVDHCGQVYCKTCDCHVTPEDEEELE